MVNAKEKVGIVASLKRALYIMAEKKEFDSWWKLPKEFHKEKDMLERKHKFIDLATEEAYRATLDSSKFGGIRDWKKFYKNIINSLFYPDMADIFLEERKKGFVANIRTLFNVTFNGYMQTGGRKIDYNTMYDYIKHYRSNNIQLTNIERILTSLPQFQYSPITVYNPKNIANMLVQGRIALTDSIFEKEPVSIGGEPYNIILSKNRIYTVNHIQKLTDEDTLHVLNDIFERKDKSGVVKVRKSLKDFYSSSRDRILHIFRLYNQTKTEKNKIQFSDRLSADKLREVFDKAIKERPDFRKMLLRDIYYKGAAFIGNDLHLLTSMYWKAKDVANGLPEVSIQIVDEKVNKIRKAIKAKFKGSREKFDIDSAIKELFELEDVKLYSRLRKYAEIKLLSSIEGKEWFGHTIDGDSIVAPILGSKYISPETTREFFNIYRDFANLGSNFRIVPDAPIKPRKPISEGKAGVKATPHDLYIAVNNIGYFIPSEQKITSKELLKLYNNLIDHPVIGQYFGDFLQERWPWKFKPGKFGLLSLTENEIKGLNKWFNRIDKGTWFQKIWSKYTGDHPLMLNNFTKEGFFPVLGKKMFGLISRPTVIKVPGLEYVRVVTPITELFDTFEVARASIDKEDIQRNVIENFNFLETITDNNGKKINKVKQHKLYKIAAMKWEADIGGIYKEKFNQEEYNKLADYEKRAVNKLISVFKKLAEEGREYIKLVDNERKNFLTYQAFLAENELARQIVSVKREKRTEFIHKWRKKFRYSIHEKKPKEKYPFTVHRYGKYWIKIKFKPTGRKEFFFPHRWASAKDFLDNLKVTIEKNMPKYRKEAMQQIQNEITRASIIIRKAKKEGDKYVYKGIDISKAKYDKYTRIANMDSEAISSAIEKRAKKIAQQEYDKIAKWYMDRDIGVPTSTMKSSVFPDFNVERHVGHIKSRNLDVQGYLLTPDVWIDYFHALHKMRHLQKASIKADKIIRRWRTSDFSHIPENVRDALVKGWDDLMTEYVRDNLGIPIEDRKALGFIQVGDKKVIDWINKQITRIFKGKVDKLSWDMNTMRRIAEVDGKLAVASLLFHQKMATSNITFGSANTMIMSGGKKYFDAIKLLMALGGKNNSLVRNISNYPELQTWEDVKNIIESSGVVLELLQRELGIRAEKGKLKDFFAGLKEVRNKQGKLTSEDIMKVAREHKVEDTIARYGGFFMGYSEKFLRYSTVLAGYLTARELYGFGHKRAIQVGRQFTEASQFMYDVTWRPRGARSNTGKILSRFRMWGWHSFSFRRKLYHLAQDAGFEPTNPDVQSFYRSVTVDLFLIALANALAFTLFDYNLPPPYSQIKDLAELVFGDDETRKWAFYGTYGASEIIPPFPPIRIPFYVFQNLLTTGDLTNIAKYQMWTWFPFGRMARDLYRTWENPEMAVDYLTGIPLMKGAKYLRKGRKVRDIPTV